MTYHNASLPIAFPHPFPRVAHPIPAQDTTRPRTRQIQISESHKAESFTRNKSLRHSRTSDTNQTRISNAHGFLKPIQYLLHGLVRLLENELSLHVTNSWAGGAKALPQQLITSRESLPSRLCVP